jgi:hypothetical protein
MTFGRRVTHESVPPNSVQCGGGDFAHVVRAGALVRVARSNNDNGSRAHDRASLRLGHAARWVSYRLIGGRAGHYLVELPAETYGVLYVGGQVRLRTALMILLLLPTLWCAATVGGLVYRARHTLAVNRLRWISAGVSLLVVIFIAMWWARWPAPNERPAASAEGNGMWWSYLEKHPSAWPTESDYTFYVWDFPIPFNAIIVLGSIWPVVAAARSGLRFVVGRATKRVGRCTGCGYDLRATPQRCPECGLDVVQSGGSERLNKSAKQSSAL